MQRSLLRVAVGVEYQIAPRRNRDAQRDLVLRREERIVGRVDPADVDRQRTRVADLEPVGELARLVGILEAQDVGRHQLVELERNAGGGAGLEAFDLALHVRHPRRHPAAQ